MTEQIPNLTSPDFLEEMLDKYDLVHKIMWNNFGSTG